MNEKQILDAIAEARRRGVAPRLDGVVLTAGSFVGADLSGADLSGANFSGSHFSNCQMAGCNLSGADLRGCKLASVDLSGANLARACLAGSEFRASTLVGCDLSEGNLGGCVLSGCDLSQSALQGAVLDGAALVGSNLSQANLRGAGLRNANLEGGNLSQADLRNAVLVGARLDKADLREADLSRADLASSNLRGANLAGVCFVRASLARANLQGATVNGADWKSVDLRGAVLFGLDLRGLVLRGVAAQGARLDGADLTGADLSGADLKHASVSGTNFTGADLSGANLDGTVWGYGPAPTWKGAMFDGRTRGLAPDELRSGGLVMRSREQRQQTSGNHRSADGNAVEGFGGSTMRRSGEEAGWLGNLWLSMVNSIRGLLGMPSVRVLPERLLEPAEREIGTRADSLLLEVKDALEHNQRIQAQKKASLKQQASQIPKNVAVLLWKLFRIRKAKAIVSPDSQAQIQRLEERLLAEMSRSVDVLEQVLMSTITLEIVSGDDTVDRLLRELTESNGRMRDLADAYQEVRSDRLVG
jgi:uncharacterized protein YjbI with pentapeptide repeats